MWIRWGFFFFAHEIQICSPEEVGVLSYLGETVMTLAEEIKIIYLFICLFNY